jgi:hypothetical protein
MIGKSMKAAAAASLLLVLLAAGCSDSSSGYPPALIDCSQYTTCETCTPALGCGWCGPASGGGVCSSDPGVCADAQADWTWNPPGCFYPAEAGVAEGGFSVPDASAEAATEASDGAHDAASEGGD